MHKRETAEQRAARWRRERETRKPRGRITRERFDPPAWPARFDGYRRHAKRYGRGLAIIRVIERECLVPSGRGYGRPFRLLAWQRRWIRQTFDEPVLTTAWSIPRGAGKSGLAAAIMFALLILDENADIVIGSTGGRTAGISYERLLGMVELNPDMYAQHLAHRAGGEPVLELPRQRSKVTPLPGELRYLVGQSPSFLLIDEAAFVEPGPLEILTSSLGKHERAQLLAITTPGLGPIERNGEPNVLHSWRELWRGGDPPASLRWLEISADPQDDPGRPQTWRKANPGIGRTVGIEAIENDWHTMSLDRFRMLRLGIWDRSETGWISPADWDRLEHVADWQPAPGSVVTLGFDGSSSNDHTALVGYAPDPGRLFVLGDWGPPAWAAAERWRVPRTEVHAAVENAFARWRVVGMLADPYEWRLEVEEQWPDLYGRDVVQALVTNQPGHMGPATDAFRRAVELEELSTDGSQTLRSHVISAVAELTAAGQMVRKNARRPAKIDALIAAILAHEAHRRIERPPMPSIW